MLNAPSYLTPHPISPLRRLIEEGIIPATPHLPVASLGPEELPQEPLLAANEPLDSELPLVPKEKGIIIALARQCLERGAPFHSAANGPGNTGLARRATSIAKKTITRRPPLLKLKLYLILTRPPYDCYPFIQGPGRVEATAVYMWVRDICLAGLGQAIDDDGLRVIKAGGVFVWQADAEPRWWWLSIRVLLALSGGQAYGPAHLRGDLALAGVAAWIHRCCARSGLPGGSSLVSWKAMAIILYHVLQLTEGSHPGVQTRGT